MGSRMRINRGQTGERRSHHALKEPRLSTCSGCGATHLRHHMCNECGNYKGRSVVDVASLVAKRQEKLKKRAAAQGPMAPKEGDKEEVQGESKPLEAGELSKK